MDIINILLSSLQSGAVDKMASKFGADPDTLSQVIASLTPKLTNEIKTKLADPETDSAPIIEKATDPEIQEIAERADEYIEREDIVEKGNDLLGYITGSKEKSKEIASQVAQETGFDYSIIKQLLPIVAPIVMGSLGKTLGGSGNVSDVKSAESSLLSFLDFDNDGSVMDDIIGMAGKFLRS
ncbi:MAG: DUF937 domain-containing protein [Epsilonproteobacteria bacterium]|nr:DUF937 domain-containing protein [Campylobacterota bacterium]